MGKTIRADKTVDVAALYTELKTHSAVFRHLYGQGYKMYAIAKMTGKLPQHVRNVVKKPLAQKS